MAKTGESQLKQQAAAAQQPPAAGAQVPAAKPKTIADEINALAPQFAKAAPAWFEKVGGGDTLARIAITEFRKTPRLAECDKNSFYGALMTCAQVGLLPGPLGHVYLIPRKIKGQMTCCFELGYKGLIDLARRSGDISTITAVAVFESELNTVQVDLGEGTVIHPYDHRVDRNDASKLAFVYAKAVLKDGSTALEVMSKSEVDAIRKRAQASDNGPWVTDYIMMARKTVLKRLCTKGQIPLSTEILREINADESVRRNTQVEPLNVYDVTGGAVDTGAAVAASVAEGAASVAPEGVDASTGEVTEEDKLFAEEGGADGKSE